MLDTSTKKRIDDCRDILVGKLPDPKAQIEQITIGLIYKFMDDMDKEAVELGGQAKFFADYSVPDPDFPKDRTKDKVVPYSKYGWDNLLNPKVTATEMLELYSESILGMDKNPNIPQLFRDIFKNAYLPYRDPETLKLFLKTIHEFEYSNSEQLGDAFEYLLSVMGSQGDAGQFRTPRHIIDFLVAIVNPGKGETILDPACGTAGFLISAFKHIKEKNNNELTPDERKKLIQNFVGYDISPDMVRLSLVNLYLHGFSDPHIFEYDTLSSEDRWNENFDVVLANPPFMSPKGGIRPHKKFTISSNRSEVLFVDYIAEHLNPKGKAGIIVPEGVIFQSGKAYKDLRKMLIDTSLYAVVSLPAGVFNPYSGVKTSILLLDKTIAKKRKDILFVKIDNDGYNLGAQRTAVKGGQLEEAIQLISDYRKGDNSFDEEIAIAHSVPKKEIAKNGDYNLGGERYRTTRNIDNSDYPHITLGECCYILNGSTPSKKDETYWKDGTIPWFTIEDVRNQGRVITKTSQSITEKALKQTSVKLLPPNTVLLCCTASVGEYAIAEIPLTTNQQFNGLVVKEEYSDKLVPRFLYQLSSVFKAELIRISGQTSFNFVSVGVLKTLQIPLPPLSIQEEIVAEIEGYQKIIDGAKAVVANYKPKIAINPDWEMVPLGKMATLINGRAYKKENLLDEGPIPVLRVGNFFSNRNWYYSDMLDLPDDKYCDEGDLLYAWSASFGPRIWEGPKVIYHYHIWKVEIKERIEKQFLFYLLEQDSEDIKSKGSGIAMMHATKGGMEQREFPVPPIETQRVIVSQIENEQALVNANKQLIALFEQKIKDRIAKVWGE